MQTLDKSREEQIVRWANHIRDNKDWKKNHTEFINAQFAKYDGFLKRILKTPNGKEKIRLLQKAS